MTSGSVVWAYWYIAKTVLGTARENAVCGESIRYAFPGTRYVPCPGPDVLHEVSIEACCRRDLTARDCLVLVAVLSLAIELEIAIGECRYVALLSECKSRNVAFPLPENVPPTNSQLGETLHYVSSGDSHAIHSRDSRDKFGACLDVVSARL